MHLAIFWRHKREREGEREREGGREREGESNGTMDLEVLRFVIFSGWVIVKNQPPCR